MTNEHSYIGRQFNNYRVIREIASGAFGSVYLAQHIFLTNRTVAIKLIHMAHLGSQEEQQRFLEEARLLEALKHPFILPIIDVGISEGFPYLIAEYAPNGSLRDHLQKQSPHPLPIEDCLRILTQIGQALEYAHKLNIIHRDLKPENILFNAAGDALLADFNVATVLTTTSVKNATTIGTPRYMAPEQFQGVISKESDQYALGCIAYELFTGHHPFMVTDPIVLMFKHVTEYPPLPTELNPQLPAHIEQAICKALSKQRTERHSNIKTFIEALHSPASTLIMPISSVSAPQNMFALTPVLEQKRLTNNSEGSNLALKQSAPIYADDQQSATHLLQTPLPLLTPIPPVLAENMDAANIFPPAKLAHGNTTEDGNNGHITNGHKSTSGRTWLLLAIAALLIIASLLTTLPKLLSQNSPQLRGNVQNTSTALSTSQPLGTTTPGTVATTALSHVPTRSAHNQPTQVPTTIPGSVPTAPPTHISTPTVGSTPASTPTHAPTTDTLTVYFINGMNGVPTAHSYQGSVTIHVTGTGEEYTNKWDDAFYQYTDANGNPITPLHTSTYPGWTLWINGGVADNFVSPIPPYNSNHDYTFTINAPGGTLTFATGDTYPKDDSGYLTVTVTQN